MLAIMGMAVSSCDRTDGDIVGVWQSNGSALSSSSTTLTINKDSTYKKDFKLYEKEYNVESGKIHINENTIVFVDEKTESGDTLVFYNKIITLTDEELILGYGDDFKEKMKYKKIYK